MNKLPQTALNNLIQGEDKNNSANFLREYIEGLEERESVLIKSLESIYWRAKRASASHDKDCTCGLCDIKQYIVIKMA